MRFFEVSATAIATTAMVSGAFAAVAPPTYETPSAAPAYTSASYTSATTTYYTTRTVMRVVETLTATRNGTTSAYATTESSTSTSVASATMYPFSNGNSTTLATGAMPSASVSYVSPPPSEGSAAQLQAFGLAAVLGLVGLIL